LAFLTGCYEEECGINAEPVVTLAFPLNFTGPPLIFDRIRILNSIKNINNAEISIGAKNYPNDLFLPVDLRTNSTTYIFERNTLVYPKCYYPNFLSAAFVKTLKTL
jgi:hypothetical protein